MATIIFIVAALTDYYDGFFAKRRNLISDFGKIMDPIADKFLILMAFFAFVQMHIIALWMFIIICGRELLITFMRLFAIKSGKILAAETAGKCKTVSQITAIIVILLFLVFQEMSVFANQSMIVRDWLPFSIYILMLIAVILTVASGISFFWNNRKFFYVR